MSLGVKAGIVTSAIGIIADSAAIFTVGVVIAGGAFIYDQVRKEEHINGKTQKP